MYSVPDIRIASSLVFTVERDAQQFSFQLSWCKSLNQPMTAHLNASSTWLNQYTLTCMSYLRFDLEYLESCMYVHVHTHVQYSTYMTVTPYLRYETEYRGQSLYCTEQLVPYASLLRRQTNLGVHDVIYQVVFVASKARSRCSKTNVV